MSSSFSKHSVTLRWIVELLNQRRIPCAFCGGLAAAGYGSKRPLNDIDLFVPNNRFVEVVELGNQYISKAAQRYCESSEGWDVEYVQFKHCDVKVEVANDRDAFIYDMAEKSWVRLNIDYSNCQYQSVLGIYIPLMHRDELIAYKNKLARPVDCQDVEAMINAS